MTGLVVTLGTRGCEWHRSDRTISGMELRHLSRFVAVAETLEPERAAEDIRELEGELGVPLFDHKPCGATLTAAGAALLEEARRVLHQAQVARSAARDGDRAARRLRIGHVPDLMPRSVARAMRALGAATPGVRFGLETGSALRLIAELRGGRLDAIVLGLPAPTAELRVTPAGHERLVVALPATHPNARSGAIALDRLKPDRLVVLPPDISPAVHSAVVSACRGAGLAPALVEVAEPRVEHVLLSVAAGEGVALLPESAAEHYADPAVRFVPVEPGRPCLESVVVTRATDDTVTAAFVRTVARAVRPEIVQARSRISLVG
jgi:DNA-binding transcriptional LysR family regulator